ncbi:acyl-CoA dehydrogenase family protein [Cupriavidus numazuensis]|uniref:3-methylmercaptopropionyl-CoA dehydrogenase n=1 Tax=Cupriavidus numazuensis TaxID=221992 RepID=A0ABM8TLH3_9BURK|nr:acyl-CoA dehydrogenase family protein [Cupriavidus numazuensis]CAG2153374.1 3-methylmercaptopropionyl-CoA dehydrogenase [Cupriavidus numazuensis]
MQYRPPIRDIRFVIEKVLKAPEMWAVCPPLADLDMSLAGQLIDEAGKFATELLAPTNAAGDREGCRLVQGNVQTPTGFASVYREFVASGWPTLGCAQEHGGQGLPQLVHTAIYEMLLSANHAWSMYPGLLQGAYEVIAAHGSDALRQHYLPRLVSGEWLAAMALTEPQAGSDLAQVKTKARPLPDGSYELDGSKVFISGGDHDLTDNIVHLVLCRVNGAPEGIKGLSLMLVPKLLPDGGRNGIYCEALEEKMGIHGSATCSIRYEAAKGWLIGEPDQGMAAMFIMMNSARLHVAMQGLGHLEYARQTALRYAADRRQMNAPGRQYKAAGGDPIACHPAIRRMLMTIQARTDAVRVLAYQTAMILDEARHGPVSVREEAAARVAIFTPIVKTLLTEYAFQGTSDALQVLGGYGYVREYGIEQHLRDSRIAMIYEGTNEIQAIDLVQRKVLRDDGSALNALLESVLEDVKACPEGLAGIAYAVRRQVANAYLATTTIIVRAKADAEYPYRVADDYLRALGYVLLSWAWLRLARAAGEEADLTYGREKMGMVEFALDWLLPDSVAHWERVMNDQARLPEAPLA